jgi:hypothetical protein
MNESSVQFAEVHHTANFSRFFKLAEDASTASSSGFSLGAAVQSPARSSRRQKVYSN